LVGQTTYGAFNVGPGPARDSAPTDAGDAMASAQRLGYTILRTLDRAGLVQPGNGSGPHVVCFSRVTVIGPLVACEVDAEWLAFSVLDLARPDVMAQLSAATRRSVKAFTQGGLTYVVHSSKPDAIQPAANSAAPGFWANRAAW
jgi:hypothetical protein